MRTCSTVALPAACRSPKRATCTPTSRATGWPIPRIGSSRAMRASGANRSGWGRSIRYPWTSCSNHSGPCARRAIPACVRLPSSSTRRPGFASRTRRRRMACCTLSTPTAASSSGPGCRRNCRVAWPHSYAMRRPRCAATASTASSSCTVTIRTAMAASIPQPESTCGCSSDSAAAVRATTRSTSPCPAILGCSGPWSCPMRVPWLSRSRSSRVSTSRIRARARMAGSSCSPAATTGASMRAARPARAVAARCWRSTR